jgi:hypothetical protein
MAKLFYNKTINKFWESVNYYYFTSHYKVINKREIIYFILSIIMVNVLINFGNFTPSISGQSSEEKSEGPIIINDPKLKVVLVVSGWVSYKYGIYW